MKFQIKNNIFIQNLQKINRFTTKNISFPILENILISIKNEILSLTATNLEIELIANIPLINYYKSGEITVSSRKLLDICRNSLNSSNIQLELHDNKIHIISNQSHYILKTLPCSNFPNHHDFNHISEFYIDSHILKTMIEKIYFSMAKQDVRYYLNGMLLKIIHTSLYMVATDGYRLGITKTILENQKIEPFSIIVTRKGIIELYKLLNVSRQLIKILISKNSIRIYIEQLIFTAQLIEGEFPNYDSLFLKQKKNGIIINCILLKQALLRAAILTHEKFCGVAIHIKNNQLKVLSDNQEEETVEDVFNIKYIGPSIKISINVYYMLDILNSINSENILLFLNNSNNSIQIEAENDASTTYIVMLLKY
ncbi:DNA polymerase III subunit beta [Buchnera aphidicola]|uniref:Beta sliding clamp n=1 Tax=Buchnera aphidicola subsp. Uroleucon sonchi TaxID=118118 RepID=A0A6C1FB31_BUCUN|nr:DNA polymerase III subunit beta [Buchnera aphidicola]QIE01780.1 DNA polymerase III subunit beta [Buchnera aphidicola (Uroleucon sonchi)]